MRMLQRARARASMSFMLALALVITLVPVTAPAAGSADVEPVVTASVPPDAYEVDNTQSQAKTIQVGAAPQQRTIHAVNNVDWAKFTAKAGGTYVIDSLNGRFLSRAASAVDAAGVKTSDLDEPLYMNLEIYDAAGNLLMGNPYFFMVGNAAAQAKSPNAGIDPFGRLVYTSAKDQVLYVRCKSEAFYSGFVTGEYALQVRGAKAAISGNVRDPEGAPVPFALVWADNASYRDATVRSPQVDWTGVGFTDVAGNYTIADIEPGNYIVEFDPQNDDVLRREYFNDAAKPESATPVMVGALGVTRGINAVLDYGTPIIAGRVVNEAGEPIEGVRVAVYYGYDPNTWYGPSHYAYTDENGEYGFNNVYLGYGGYRLQFYDDRSGGTHYITEYWDDAPDLASADTIVMVDDVAPGSYDATLAANNVLARGTVTDEGGAPLNDMVVEARDTNNNHLQTCYTNSAGEWFFTGTMSTNVVFHALDPQRYYVDEWFDDQPDFDSADTTAVAPGNTVVADFELADMPPSVTGKVTDELTGRPIKGVNVWAYVQNGPFAWWPLDVVSTDAGGNYVFEHLTGYNVKIQFADPGGFYSNEWWNNKPSLSTAVSIDGYPGGEVVCNAKLLPRDGRVYGADRFSNAVVIAEQQFPGWQGVSDVIIASGDDRAAADPLSAGSLCWAYDAPLMLTSGGGLPSSLVMALKQIAAAGGSAPERSINIPMPSGVRVHVVGGPASIPDAQLAQIEAIVGAGNVERLPYGDRYETARQVALRAHEMAVDRGRDPGIALVANGADPSKFFDALSASAVSAHIGAPILLTRADVAPAATVRALSEIETPTVVVIGGTGSVSGAAYGQVGGDMRIAGATRYDTSVAVANTAARRGWLSVDGVGLAAKVPDALTGGAAMGLAGGPLLVTAPDSLPAPLYTFIDDNDYLISRVTIFGGPRSVTANVWTRVKQALKQ